MKIKTFLGLTLGATYKCVEVNSGEALVGTVKDIGRDHAKLAFPDGTHVDLNIKSLVTRENNVIRFR